MLTDSPHLSQYSYHPSGSAPRSTSSHTVPPVDFTTYPSVGCHLVISSPRQSNPMMGTNSPLSSAVMVSRHSFFTSSKVIVHCFLQSGNRMAKFASPLLPSTSATSSAHKNTPSFVSSL